MDKQILKEELIALIEKRLQSTGYVFYVEYIFMGKRRFTQLYYSQGRSVDRATIADDLKKIYPEAQLVSFKKADFVPGSPLVVMREDVDYQPEGETIEEGMTMKDFKANRQKNKRKEASDDAKKRGHVGKEWYNSGKTYSTDHAKRMRSNLDADERSTRHRSAVDPEGDDSNYSADKTKNPKKLRKQAAMGEGAAWTKKSGQNSEGGLNEKGRKSYERENPGSDLKAPSKEVGNPRRKSFCARMKGMRKRQKPENNTGDDRLSKSLRAWNC